MNTELIAHIEYLQDKDIRFKHVDEKYLIGVKRWFLCGGNLPSSTIAEYLNIDDHKLTLKIQKQMSNLTGIEIKDNAPSIVIHNTERELMYKSPRSYRYEWQPVYELDYYLYLTNNTREQIIHNYKLFLNESRSRDIQSGGKVLSNQVSQINISL
jgi:hypothetical protein